MYQAKKNVLFLTSHLPYPPFSGGRLREYELIKRLASYYNIYLIIVTKTITEDLEHTKFLKDFCKVIKVYPSLPLEQIYNNPFLKEQYPEKILRIISSQAKTYISKLLNLNLIDLIHLESFYMGYLLPKKVTPPIVLAAQNIEYDLIKQEIEIEKNPSITLIKQLELTKKYEILNWKLADICVPLTDHDAIIMHKYLPQKKIKLISNGTDHLKIDSKSPYNKDRVSAENSLLIIGNYQYKPNEDGVVHFCREIFPYIQNKISTIQLYIVGNKPTSQITNFNSLEGINIIGSVPDIKPYLEKATVFVCPLRLGGGIKVKMLEALSYNLPIVTSPIGAQGLPKLSPPGFWVAENDMEFAKMVVSLVKNKESRHQLQKMTRKVLNKLPSWDTAVSQLADLYNQLISKRYEEKH